MHKTWNESDCLLAEYLGADPVTLCILAFYCVLSVGGFGFSVLLMRWQYKHRHSFHVNARVLFWNHHLSMLFCCVGLFVYTLAPICRFLAARTPCDFMLRAFDCNANAFVRLFFNLTLFFALAGCAVERIYATVFYRNYETKSSPHFSFLLVATQWIVSLLAAFIIVQFGLDGDDGLLVRSCIELKSATVEIDTADAIHSSPQFVILMLACLATDVFALLVFYNIYSVNRRKRKLLTTAHLGAKYQIAENVRVSEVHMPMIMCHVGFFMTTCAFLLMPSLINLNALQYVRFWNTWSCFLNFYLILMPVLTMYEFRAKIATHKKNKKTEPLSIQMETQNDGKTKIIPFDNDIQEEHFAALQDAWN